MPKKFRSFRRAQRRGHLDLHVDRDHNNIITVALVRTYKRFGKPNKKDVYMVINRIKGDPILHPNKVK